jgi:RNA polymerase sigma-70 factor, ECF subfamily
VGFQSRSMAVFKRYTPMNTPTAPQRVKLDNQEFLAFYQEYFASIYRFIYRKVGSQEEAEDLASQVFMKAFRHLDYKYNAQKMRSWLFQVAHTTIADYWRTFYRAPTSSLEVLLEAGWEGPPEDDILGMNSSAAERVQGILQDIPERFREVLTCRFLLNLSIRETAERMGVSEANAKTLQYRALKHAAGLNASRE